MRDSLLLPDYHPVGDLFVLDNLFPVSSKMDVSMLRSDVTSMEHPIFKLSSRKSDGEKLDRYEHGDLFIEVKAGPEGFATIFDKDIWIYCISNLVHRLNNNQEIGQTVRIKVHDLMMMTNRDSGGAGYDRLEEALDRLAGTRIKTNILTGQDADEKVTNFGLIESYKYPRRKNGAKRLDYLEVVLPKWLLNAIAGEDVLTLHPEYFHLRKGVHRQIYDIVRKHCGDQPSWKIGVGLLKKKCGTTQADKHFASYLRELVGNEVLPGYDVTFERRDMVLFTKRAPKQGISKSGSPAPSSKHVSQPASNTAAREGKILISFAGIEQAKLWAPRWDINAIEADYIAWAKKLGQARNEDARFIDWVRKIYKGQPPK